MTNGGRRTEDGKWKIGQCSVGPETAIIIIKFDFIAHPYPGRRRIETDNKGILETLLQTATVGPVCGQRAIESVREQMVGIVIALNDLTNTEPVKLVRPQNDFRMYVAE